MLKVQITANLIEQGLQIGNEIPKTRVTQGLPALCTLKEVSFENGAVTFLFDSATVKEDQNVNILLKSYY